MLKALFLKIVIALLTVTVAVTGIKEIGDLIEKLSESDNNVSSEIVVIEAPTVKTYVSTFEEMQSAINSADKSVYLVATSSIEATKPITVDKDITIESAENFDFSSFDFVFNGGSLTLISGTYDGFSVDGKGDLTLDYVTLTSMLELKENTDITLNIVNHVEITGDVDEDGIRVPETSTITITGDSLKVAGNNYLEYLSVSGYGNTDDSSLNGLRGSGIGNAYGKVGDITIENLSNLSCYGYGEHAFGIGGNGTPTITISDSNIDYVRGGFAENNLISDTKYGKTEAEGGAAIGLGFSNDGVGKIILTNSTIELAEGGSKSAAIGGMYWSSAYIEIDNCELKDIIGGNCSAAIGGSRVNKDYISQQIIDIKINNSTVNALGGDFGSGIGNGYDTYCVAELSLCNIEITGNSNITAKGGKYGAGIGTGFHMGTLTGFIDETCTINAQSGDVNYYKDSYTTAQAIGYGVCDPTREFSNETVTFTVAGQVIDNPVELLND